jgi:hypothetical protein
MIANRHFKRQALRERSHARLSIVPSISGMTRQSRVRLWFFLPSVPRAAFRALAILAVLIQGLVVQTHIHHPVVHPSQMAGSLGAPAISPADTSSTASRDPIKGDDDSANCALCHAFTHAGQFLHSAGFVACAPVSCNVHLLPFTDPLPARVAVSHNWQGRAPPLI